MLSVSSHGSLTLQLNSSPLPLLLCNPSLILVESKERALQTFDISFQVDKMLQRTEESRLAYVYTLQYIQQTSYYMFEVRAARIGQK